MLINLRASEEAILKLLTYVAFFSGSIALSLNAFAATYNCRLTTSQGATQGKVDSRDVKNFFAVQDKNSGLYVGCGGVADDNNNAVGAIGCIVTDSANIQTLQQNFLHLEASGLDSLSIAEDSAKYVVTAYQGNGNSLSATCSQ